MSDMKMEPIWLANGEAANLVVLKLKEAMTELGKVSRHDLFELLAIEPTFKDHTWGWTSLDGLELRAEMRDGSVELIMPPLTNLSNHRWERPKLPPKPPTTDELITEKAKELQAIYDNRTAGDKTFEGFLADFTRSMVGSLASELLEEWFFGKKKS